MADRKTTRLQRLAQAVRRESALARAAVRAYNRLFKALEPLLASSGYDPSVLDDRLPAWRDAVDEELAPEVTATYLAALEGDAREGVTLDPQAYATRYLATVHNRLVGISDYVFDQIAGTLAEGNAKGESIPELAARIDGLFTDTQRWANRATVVARTEVVGANNAGQQDAARASASHLDVPYALVVKEWLATPGTRTRHTHAVADGQQVLGLDTRFHVGAGHLERPGDPTGPPEEVIQCRCSALYFLPGDLDYPDDPSSLAASARLAHLFDVSQMPPKLQAYWLGPEGAAKIGYGTPGQFKRCQGALRGKVPGHMIDGTCANLIHKATGEWPGKHGAHAGEVLTWGAMMMRLGLPGPGFAAAMDAENPMVEPPPGAIPADAAPAYDPEDDDSTGIVLVALPAESDTVHGIGPEVKHCTIVYLGDQATQGIGDTAALNELVAGLAAGLQPFTVAVDKLDTLGREEPAEVWLLDTADNPLPGLRDDALKDATVQQMLEGTEQFPDYLPHVTIGYPASQDDPVADDEWAPIMDAAADVATITFDRLACWHGTDRTEYPLGDTPMADTSPPKEDDAPMTAAATEAPQAPADGAATDLTWVGVLCPEGVATGDKRKFAEGSMQWLASPVVLKAMFADKPGHDDSVPVGLIQGIERTPEGKLAAHGTWDTGDNAVEARRQNIAGLLRGVSVDLDDVEMHLEDDAGNVLEGDAIWDMEVEPTLVVDKGRIRAATLWCTPAYVEAYVLDSTVADDVPDTSIVGAEGTTPLGLAAAAAYAEAAAPARARAGAAPSSVFSNPGLTIPTPLTILPDGQFFGHLATWGTCFAGETEYLTEGGVRTLKETVGTVQRVLTSTGGLGPAPRAAREFGGRWVDAEIRSFGVQPLMKVTLRRFGQTKEVYATAEHRWLTTPFGKEGFRHSPRRVVTTKDLVAGSRLSPLFPKRKVTVGKGIRPSQFGVAHGFTFGDGTRHRDGCRVDLFGDKDSALMPYFSLSTNWAGTNPNGVNKVRVANLPAFFKDPPSLGESLSYLYGWLAGYFAADGTVSPTGTPILFSATRGHLEHVRDVCMRLGIGTSEIKTFMRVGAGDYAGLPGKVSNTRLSPLHRITLIANTLTEEFFIGKEHRRRFQSRPEIGEGYTAWRVVSTEETDRVEEVYCAVVPEHENFTLVDNINVMNCHIGIEGACVTPPTSEADYAYMCTGMYACSDDVVIPVGTLTMGTGHADLALGWRPTVDHYDDTGTAAGWFSVGEDAIGIWMAGVLDDALPEPQRLALERSGSVSGDWRNIGGNLELVAALAVNVPGFPIPRVQSRVASLAAAGGRVQPMALVASGVVPHRAGGSPIKMPSVAELAREVVAYQARQARADASRRALRKHRQLTLAGKISNGR